MDYTKYFIAVDRQQVHASIDFPVSLAEVCAHNLQCNEPASQWATNRYPTTVQECDISQTISPLHYEVTRSMVSTCNNVRVHSQSTEHLERVQYISMGSQCLKNTCPVCCFNVQ